MKYIRTLKYSCVAIVILSLAACQSKNSDAPRQQLNLTGPSSETTSGATLSTSSPKTGLGIFSRNKNEKKYVSFNDLNPEKAGHNLKFAAVPSQSGVQSFSNDTIAIRAPKFEAYMRSIADRLMAHWHGEIPENMGFFLSPQDEFNAAATPSGDIYVSIRAIETFKSEDELAAILAHEIGHVVLKHHEDEKQAKNLAKVGEAAVAAYSVAAMVGRMESRETANGVQLYVPVSQQGVVGNDVINASAAFAAGITLVSDVGVSAYSRHQENVADRFGAEMLTHAGYDNSAMLTFLEHIRTAHVEGKKRKRDYKLQAQNLEQLFTEVFALGIRDIASILKSTHPSPDSRLKKVRKTVRELSGDNLPPDRQVASLERAKAASEYRNIANFYNKLHKLTANTDGPNVGHELRKLVNTPLGRTAVSRTMAYTTLTQNIGENEAHKLLVKSTNKAAAPLNYHTFVAMGYAKKKDIKRTKVAIDEMRKRFSWPVTYPTAIKAAAILEDEQWQNSLYQRCKATGMKNIISACDKAKRGERSDEQYRKPEGLLSAVTDAGGNFLQSMLH